MPESKSLQSQTKELREEKSRNTYTESKQTKPYLFENAARTSDFSPEKRLAEPHRRDYGIITPKLGSEAKKNSDFGDFVIEIGLNIVYKW